MRTAIIGVGAWLVVAGLAVAGALHIENARLETRSADGPLAAVVGAWSEAASPPAWIGWRVPMRPGDEVLCCFDRDDHRWAREPCNLETTHRHFISSSRRPSVALGRRSLVILLRAGDDELEEMQTYSDDCPIDAAGAAVDLIEGVPAAASARYLHDLIVGGSGVADEALMALALHDTPVAASLLTNVARTSESGDTRGEALFWLALSGADSVLSVLLEAVESDPDPDVREEAIFAISQLPRGEGSTVLLDLARDRSRPSAVRQEAFFWFVQSDTDRALALIEEILAE